MRVLIIVLTSVVVVTLGVPLAAQEKLPGLTTRGRYVQGSLATSAQPMPDPAPAGAIYGVGAWPSYTPPLADGPGRDVVVGVCNTCHSTTYITMQPPLPAATWKAEVDKMIKTFGASIADDTAQRITEYLQAHYTPETRQR
jgi:hypothetical protein